MAANIIEAKNLFTISESKISMRKQPTVSVQSFLFDNLCVLTT